MKNRALAVAAATFIGCSACQPVTSAGKAEALVREQLADGQSARFENVVATRLPNGREVVCGWVNAKNPLGAYAGFDRFLVFDSRTVRLRPNWRDGDSESFGQCAAADPAASARLLRDVNRAMDGYAASLD